MVIYWNDQPSDDCVDVMTQPFPLGHTVLLRTVRRHELLLWPIACDLRRVVATGKHQAIVAA